MSWKKEYTVKRAIARQTKAALVKIMSIDGEIWKYVKGYDGLYMVSNKQRMKKLGYWTVDGKYKKEKLISINFNKKYPTVKVVAKDGGKADKLFHRLVCDAFFENPFNKPEVNHLKGWRFGHTPDNLEWATRCENVKHAKESGFYHRKNKAV